MSFAQAYCASLVRREPPSTAIEVGPAWPGPPLAELQARRFILSGRAGPVEGVVAFFVHEGAARLLIALAGGERSGDLLDAGLASMASLRPVLDARLVEVEPMRIRSINLEKSMTLRQWAAGHPGMIDLESLALINHVDPDEVLAGGRRIKSVRRFEPPAVEAGPIRPSETILGSA